MLEIFLNQKQETNDPAINNIGNLFRLKKENEAIKDKIVRDIRNLFVYEEKDYYQPLRLYNFWTNNYIEYESNSDRNKTLTVEKYVN